jgi:hypothetical protein
MHSARLAVPDEDASDATNSFNDISRRGARCWSLRLATVPRCLWVASFPRSANTFLRIILYRLYGVRTSTIYDLDGVAERLGKDLIAFTDRPGSLAELRASDELHFTKTHRQRDADIDENDPAICLVRDPGRAPR